MEFCDYHFLEGVRIIKYIITVLKIVIPIIIVGMGTYDLFKTVMNPDKDSIYDKLGMLVKRVISALIIFIAPSIIQLVFDLTTNISDLMLVFNDCIKNANSEYIKALKHAAYEQTKANLNQSQDFSATYQKNANITSGLADGEILEVAQKIWQQVAAGDYVYGGSSIPNTGNTVDCSGYVSWVLYELGFDDFGGWQHTTGTFISTNWNETHGWEEISVAAGEDVTNKLQPGDILVRDNGGGVGAAGHMNITVSAENGTVMAYDCGSEKNWKNSGGNPVDKTAFAKTDSRPGKIIRVKLSEDSETSGDSSIISSSNDNNLIFIGDSRMYGMCDALYNAGDKCAYDKAGNIPYYVGKEIYFGQVSMGYKWFNDTVVPEVNKIVQKNGGHNIIINLGVNDLYNVNNYITKYNYLAASDWKDQDIIIVSVNPVDDAKAQSNGYSQLTKEVDNFNNNIRSGLSNSNNLTYCDVNSKIKSNFSASDGVHYDNATYKKIYEEMLKCVN